MTVAQSSPRLRLLGRFGLDCGAGPVDVCAGGQRILAYLGLHGHATRTSLAGTLWPDLTEERARGNLRTTLWRLRRGRQPVVRSEHDHLSLADAVDVDTHAFAEWALRVVSSPETLGVDEVPQLLRLDGDLLPSWDEDWVAFERERMRQLQLHSLETVARHLIARGRHALALEAALACVRIEPLRESAHRAVVAVHLAENNMVEAVRHYRAFREFLLDELGLEPSARFLAMLPPAGDQPPTAGRRTSGRAELLSAHPLQEGRHG
ncbi:AfsR/SARP family transcriptional regulator [Wenjunlia tyrosinilytica]|uniref:Bacterial transcriptional activator domain-containing protein n=1 Tax=Wenjunlia tyrosinilytica TaxID=1544741 RepID=A0A918DZ73_9ACTN|nr:BTAD domain-containing putative transcriptional regulator [Wenjunlia tyrosinilytica]GGO94484.1 hypothetical protein GCM10012280_49500 [Wenjunlia tyrosinilytica]